jgi:excisionase family DNA binding protein
MTYKEAALMLGIGHRTLQEWVAQGKIRAIKMSPRCVRFRRSDLEQFVARLDDRVA